MAVNNSFDCRTAAERAEDVGGATAAPGELFDCASAPTPSTDAKVMTTARIAPRGRRRARGEGATMVDRVRLGMMGADCALSAGR